MEAKKTNLDQYLTAPLLRSHQFSKRGKMLYPAWPRSLGHWHGSHCNIILTILQVIYSESQRLKCPLTTSLRVFPGLIHTLSLTIPFLFLWICTPGTVARPWPLGPFRSFLSVPPYKAIVHAILKNIIYDAVSKWFFWGEGFFWGSNLALENQALRFCKILEIWRFPTPRN